MYGHHFLSHRAIITVNSATTVNEVRNAMTDRENTGYFIHTFPRDSSSLLDFLGYSAVLFVTLTRALLINRSINPVLDERNTSFIC